MSKDTAASPVTTWYLEMTSADEIRPARPPRVACRIERVDPPYPALNEFLYREVGAPWHWVDRLTWSREGWRAWVEREALETRVAYVGGNPAGYAELETQPGGQIEIAYFGLLAPWFGKGLGGHLLTRALERAWQRSPRRVWVHTCSLDAPAALKNYQARGMRIYDVVRSGSSSS